MLSKYISGKGFCDYDILFESDDNRGSYMWNETQVGDTDMAKCFYELQSLDGEEHASRMCLSHQTWAVYDGSLCATSSTFRLHELSRVS